MNVAAHAGDYANPVVLGMLCFGVICLVVVLISKFRGGDQ
jgi:hypothetical protein